MMENTNNKLAEEPDTMSKKELLKKELLKKDYIVMVMTDDATNINSVRAYTTMGAIRTGGEIRKHVLPFCEFDNYQVQELKWTQLERNENHLGDVYVIEPRTDYAAIVRYYEIIGT